MFLNNCVNAIFTGISSVALADDLVCGAALMTCVGMLVAAVNAAGAHTRPTCLAREDRARVAIVPVGTSDNSKQRFQPFNHPTRMKANQRTETNPTQELLIKTSKIYGLYLYASG